MREEQERWKGVPEWKKKIMLDKTKKKQEEEVCSEHGWLADLTTCVAAR